jgi:hypothetical protein
LGAIRAQKTESKIAEQANYWLWLAFSKKNTYKSPQESDIITMKAAKVPNHGEC